MTTMKKPLLLLVILTLIGVQSFAQDQPKSVERTIQIKDGDDPRVTITEKVDGKTTVKELEGQAARQYIEDREEKRESVREEKRTIVEIEINEDDIEEMKASMRQVRVDVASELEKVSEEIKHMNVDSILEDIGVEIERSMNEVRYHFDMDDNASKSVIVIRSNGQDEDEEIDVQVEVRSDSDGDTEKEVEVTRTKMVVEDVEESQTGSSSIQDLRVYPVPSKGDVQIQFENDEDGPVHIQIKDLQGKTVREMKIKGEGKKNMRMNLDKLPSGTYTIEIREGKSKYTKRLVLE